MSIDPQSSGLTCIGQTRLFQHLLIPQVCQIRLPPMFNAVQKSASTTPARTQLISAHPFVQSDAPTDPAQIRTLGPDGPDRHGGPWLLRRRPPPSSSLGASDSGCHGLKQPAPSYPSSIHLTASGVMREPRRCGLRQRRRLRRRRRARLDARAIELEERRSHLNSSRSRLRSTRRFRNVPRRALESPCRVRGAPRRTLDRAGSHLS